MLLFTECQEYSIKIFQDLKSSCRAKETQLLMNGVSYEGKFPHMAQIGKNLKFFK